VEYLTINDDALSFTRQVTIGGMEIESMADWLRTHSQAQVPQQ
jgi:hypothetical protein